MLGTRGCRLGLQWPEIYEMQVRAIVRAAAAVEARTGEAPLVEIMHPLVGFREELARLRELTERVAAEEPSVAYLCGTMIELPRACIRADEIAEVADFCSFGTNDLTQTALGFSRDDAEGKFLTYYLEHGILERNPFEVLDQEGVGDLMRIAVERGRGVKPELKMGICGEHGGEPRSVAFCHRLGLDYVSCSPYRVPLARLAAAQAALADAGVTALVDRRLRSARLGRSGSLDQRSRDADVREREADDADADGDEHAERSASGAGGTASARRSRRCPPTRPPRWPPIEIPGTANVKREVDEDQDHRLPHQRSGREVLEDQEGADQAEDRARGADRDGEGRAEPERAGRAGEARDEVDEQEARRPERLLDDRAEPVEGEHVEGEVEQAAVQEHRRHEAPPVAVRDGGSLERPVREELPAGEIDPAALRRRDHVDDDVDRDQHHRRRGRDGARPTPHALDRAGGRRLDRADVRVIRAADPDRREGHAVLADRAAALRARDERLAVRMAVAMGRVRHGRLA